MTVAGQGSNLYKDSMEVQDVATTQNTADTDKGDSRGAGHIRDASFLCRNIGGIVRHLGDPDWIRYVQKFDFITLVELL